jgi:hypothetical protein
MLHARRGLIPALGDSERMNLIRGIISVLFVTCIAFGGCIRKSSGTPPTSAVDAGLEPAVAMSGRFTTVRVDIRTNRLELFLRDETGRTFNRFDQLAAWLTGLCDRQVVFTAGARRSGIDIVAL